jgi:hypothetical protein
MFRHVCFLVVCILTLMMVWPCHVLCTCCCYVRCTVLTATGGLLYRQNLFHLLVPVSAYKVMSSTVSFCFLTYCIAVLLIQCVMVGCICTLHHVYHMIGHGMLLHLVFVMVSYVVCHGSTLHFLPKHGLHFVVESWHAKTLNILSGGFDPQTS